MNDGPIATKLYKSDFRNKSAIYCCSCHNIIYKIYRSLFCFFHLISFHTSRNINQQVNTMLPGSSLTGFKTSLTGLFIYLTELIALPCTKAIAWSHITFLIICGVRKLVYSIRIHKSISTIFYFTTTTTSVSTDNISIITVFIILIVQQVIFSIFIQDTIATR